MSKSLDHQIVLRAREIIAEPDRWIQGDFAVCENDVSADPTDKRAHRFCAVGALRRAAHEISHRDSNLANRVQSALERFANTHFDIRFEDNLEEINDDNDHATVLKLFDEFLAANAS